MSAENPIFQYYLFGIYVIELGRFFRQKFKNFKLNRNDIESLKSQVYFGTPRAAFRYYIEKFNGQVKLPMINYYLIDVERLPQYEPANVILKNEQTFNPETNTMEVMKAPGVFQLTYSINMWNNNLRERDYMMHAIYNAFPKGEVSLVYFPDLINYPDVYLLMPHTMELTVADETEVEGLDEQEVRDKIKTTFTLRCTRAFVPYESIEVPTISYVQFQSVMNDFVSGINETIQTKEHIDMFGAYANTSTLNININDVNIVT